MPAATEYMLKYKGREQEITAFVERLGYEVDCHNWHGIYLAVDLVDFEKPVEADHLAIIEKEFNAEVVVRSPWDDGLQYVTRLLFVSRDLPYHYRERHPKVVVSV